jgi:hypothetical protein
MVSVYCTGLFACLWWRYTGLRERFDTSKRRKKFMGSLNDIPRMSIHTYIGWQIIKETQITGNVPQMYIPSNGAVGVKAN